MLFWLASGRLVWLDFRGGCVIKQAVPHGLTARFYWVPCGFGTIAGQNRAVRGVELRGTAC